MSALPGRRRFFGLTDYHRTQRPQSSQRSLSYGLSDGSLTIRKMIRGDLGALYVLRFDGSHKRRHPGLPLRSRAGPNDRLDRFQRMRADRGIDAGRPRAAGVAAGAAARYSVA